MPVTDWRTFLTSAEVERIAGIDKENRALKAEYRRIYDRCRKRMAARTSRQQENGLENQPL